VGRDGFKVAKRFSAPIYSPVAISPLIILVYIARHCFIFLSFDVSLGFVLSLAIAK